MRVNPVIGFVLSIFLVVGIASAAQAQTVTVASLAQDLAAATTETGIATLVSNARTAGLTDEQIANAFGRASVTTDNASTLSAGYSSFVSSSSVSASTLSSSYSSGVTTAQQGTGGGGGGGGGTEGGLNAPTGGSGGGGGSSNE